MSSAADKAAALLADAHDRRQAIDRLAPALIPGTVDEAYAIQDAVIARRGGGIGGWKVGISALGMSPSCAPVFAADIMSSGTCLKSALIHQPAIEIELAFRLERDLPVQTANYTEADILASFSFIPLLELVGGRFREYALLTAEEKLADQNGNEAFVVGEPISNWQTLNFRTIKAEILIDGVTRQSALDTHPAGNPLPLVVWQANHCVERGMRLKPGDIVTTGSLQGATPVFAGSSILGRWGQLREVALSLD